MRFPLSGLKTEIKAVEKRMNNILMLSSVVSTTDGNILTRIGDWFETIGMMLWTSTKGFFYMILVVVDSLKLPPLFQQCLPAFMGSFLFAVVIIAVIKGIFGR